MYQHHKKRGILIVFEGVNGCSKTTTINEILKYAIKYENVKVFKFPDRSGQDGPYIDGFLKGKIEINSTYDKLSLFANNRLQYLEEIVTLLENGTTVICDRYIYSAIVYQLPVERQCSDVHLYSMASIVSYFDKYMPKPDITFLLDGNFLHIRKDKQIERYHYNQETQEIIFNYFGRILSMSNTLYFVVEPIHNDVNGTAVLVMNIIDKFYNALSHTPLQYLYQQHDEEKN